VALALLFAAAFAAQQALCAVNPPPGWLASPLAGQLITLFSPGHLLLLLLLGAALVLVGSALEDALGPFRFSLTYAWGAAIGAAIFFLTGRNGTGHLSLAWALHGAAVSLILGVAMVRLYGLRIRAAYFFVAPRVAASDVLTLPVAVVVAAWLAGPAILALAQHAPKALLLSLAPNAATLILGVVGALLLGLRREDIAENGVAHARLLRDAGSPSAAAEYLQRLVGRLRDGPEVRLELAESYAACGRPNEATRHFVKAIEQFLGKGDKHAAGQTYIRLRHLLPNASVPPALELRLSGLLASLGWKDDALAALNHVANGRGRPREAYSAALQAADSYCRMGRPERGIAILERARRHSANAEQVAVIDDAIRRCERFARAHP